MTRPSFAANTRRAFLIATACSLTTGAMAGEAERLAQSIHDRLSGRGLSTFGRMELLEKDRQPRMREIYTFRLDRGQGESANLIRFVAPQDIAGTGLLSIDKADGSADQWLYLPELDRVRRIAGDRKKGRFVGSELYFEDLQQRKPSLDRHRLLGKEAVGPILCDVLESVPLDSDSSTYRKRVSWVDPATFLVHRVDYFEKSDNAPSKRWLLNERKLIQGLWTVTDSRMIDLSSDRETRLVVEVAKYDRKLPAKLFTPQSLADESLEAEHRP